MVFSKKARQSWVQYGQVLKATKNITIETGQGISTLIQTVKVLTPNQQALILSTKGLTETQIKYALIQNGVAESEIKTALAAVANKKSREELTVAMAQNILMTQGLTEAKAKEVLADAGIDVSDKRALFNKLKLNKQLLINKLTQEGYTAAEIKGITATLGLNAATNTLTAGIRGLGAAIKANPLGIILMALSLVTMGVQKLTQAQEESLQKAKDAAQAYKQEKDSLENLRQEYLDIVDSNETEAKKNEQLIEWKKKLVKAYKDEKDAIDDVTTARETGFAVIDKEQYYNALDLIEKNEKEYKKAQKALESNLFSYTASSSMYTSLEEKYKDKLKEFGIIISSFHSGSISNANYTSTIKIDFDTKSAEEAKRKVLDALNWLDGQENGGDAGLKISLKKTYETISENIEKYSTIYNEQISAYAQKYFYEFTQTADGALEQVADSGSFQKWKDKVLEMAGDSEPLKKALEELADERFPEYSKALEDSINSQNKNALSVKKFTSAYEDLSEALEELISKQKKLEDVLAKVRVGISLTGEEVLELLSDFPDISEYIKPTADGYTVTVEGIKAANAELTKNLKETNAKNITDTQKSIQALKDLKQAAINMNNGGTDENGVFYSPGRKEDVDEYIRLLEETENIRKAFGVGTDLSNIDDALKELETSLNGYTVVEDIINKAFDGIVLDEAYDEAKSKIDDYNDTIKSLNASITALGNSEKLNYDEMTALVDKIPELADFYEEQDGKYIFPVDKLEEWKDKTYDARNDYIDGLQEQLKAEEEIARNEVKAARAIVSVQEKFGNSEDKAKAQESLDYAENKLKKILGIGYKLSALREELTVDEDTDVSDELQNQIDKYNTIIDAIKIVRDQYSEAIDSEIEALEDSKDALKEANDERQREIDLREAIINLENAKKRKVWVFSNSGGFQQVQDKGAIKEAEEKYRDLITDIQEDAIDKQIEERKKLQDAWNEETDRITGAEQDIQDAMTVRQALKQLGLSSEKDLAALPESTLREISDKLADAMVRKENEDNKENPEYKPVTLDDILKSMGAGVTAEEFKRASSDLPTLNEYNLAKTFADELKKQREDMVSSVVNNSGNVFSPNIYVTTQSEKDIAGEVEKTMEKVFTQFCNTIK